MFILLALEINTIIQTNLSEQQSKVKIFQIIEDFSDFNWCLNCPPKSQWKLTDFCTSFTTIFYGHVFSLLYMHCREDESCSLSLDNHIPQLKACIYIRHMICLTDNQYFIICRQAALANKLFWNAHCALQDEALLCRKTTPTSHTACTAKHTT